MTGGNINISYFSTKAKHFGEFTVLQKSTVPSTERQHKSCCYFYRSDSIGLESKRQSFFA